MSGTIQFGRIPYGVIDAGAVAQMKPADTKVYLVIAAHANQNWRAWVGLDRLQKLTGMTRQGVLNGIKRLEAAGLISVERGGGRANTNLYEILIKSQPPLTVSGGETVNPDERKGQRANEKRVNGGAINSQPPLTRTEKNREGTDNNTVVDDSDESTDAETRRNEVVSLLTDAGVWHKEADKLARRPDVTAPRIRDLIEQCQGKANPPGYLTEMIRRGCHVPKPETQEEVCKAVTSGLITSINGTAIDPSKVRYNASGVSEAGKTILAADDIAGADFG